MVLRDRHSFLSYTVSLVALSAIVAGCSTDFDRFSRAALPKATQTSATNQTNAYPADVDPTTTASVRSRVVPVSSVGEGALATTPQGVYHKPEPMYAVSSSAAQPTYSNPYPNPPSQPSPVQKSELPSPIQLQKPAPQPVSYETTASVNPQVSETPIALPVEAETPQATYEPDSPASAPVAPQVVEPAVSDGGWGDSRGTRYQVKAGETLFNLSKRFGVPVSALMTANSIEDSNDIKAGQIITIPNYNYAETAPVSAPDSDPNTRAARASTGLIGEPDASQFSIPTRRPIQTASLGGTLEPAPQAVATPAAPTLSAADDGDPKSAGKHRVKPGDSLSRIAAVSGVSVDALKRANGLKTDSIRVGQTLTIPAQSQLASVEKSAPAGTSTSQVSQAKPEETAEHASAYAKPETTPKPVASATTPESSGLSQFRWPVKGRVVTQYREKDGSQINDGIDISVPEGTAVRAAENGVVIYAGNDIETYGNLLLVRHQNGWVSAYAHNKSFDVKKGASIRRGQIIARSGRTGHAKQPKLHFELRKNSEPVNPLDHLARI